MNGRSLSQPRWRAPLAALGLALGMGSAWAQADAMPSYGGAAIGSTSFGTGVKLFVGGRSKHVFGWEAQITSFGSEDYAPGYSHSAWAIGGSGVARMPLAPSFSAFGKLGVHYLQPHRGGPGVGDPGSSLELGFGAGLQWQFSANGAMRLEFENIGGTDGDFSSVGLQFSF